MWHEEFLILVRTQYWTEYSSCCSRRKAIERGEGFVTLKAHEGSLPLQHTELVSLILSDVDGLVADMDALEIVRERVDNCSKILMFSYS